MSLDCGEPIPCPEDCSGNGDCVLGKCWCKDFYSGDDCAKYVFRVNKIVLFIDAE